MRWLTVFSDKNRLIPCSIEAAPVPAGSKPTVAQVQTIADVVVAI